MPGSILAGQRFRCGPLCQTVACHPAIADWPSAASTDPETVRAWWQRGPYSVLLATGHAFDVIEVPARLGGPAAAQGPGPVAVTPTGRFMFLVEPGDGLRPELAAQLDVIRHCGSSWIPAPPTRTPAGPIRWAVHPEVTGWRVPDPYHVQRLLVAALPDPALLPAPR